MRTCDPYDQPRPTLLPVEVETVPGLYLAGDATAVPVTGCSHPICEQFHHRWQ